jgi:hypothetical protein
MATDKREVFQTLSTTRAGTFWRFITHNGVDFMVLAGSSHLGLYTRAELAATNLVPDGFPSFCQRVARERAQRR